MTQLRRITHFVNANHRSPVFTYTNDAERVHAFLLAVTRLSGGNSSDISALEPGNNNNAVCNHGNYANPGGHRTHYSVASWVVQHLDPADCHGTVHFDQHALKAMPLHPDILVATNNQGKIREITQGLRGFPFRLRFLSEFPDLRSVSEVGNTYEENATLKALEYSKHTRLCALADDSGLEVDALGGRPGPHSARYGGAGMSDLDRIEFLLASLRQLEGSERRARFVSSMVLAVPTGDHDQTPGLLHVTTGFCEGRITVSPRGSNGFGYDPVFAPDGYGETFGELSDEVKSRVSHRAQALLKMKQFIEQWISSA